MRFSSVLFFISGTWATPIHNPMFDIFANVSFNPLFSPLIIPQAVHGKKARGSIRNRQAK